MKTLYYSDNMSLYKKENSFKTVLKFLNKLIEDPKIANIFGCCGAIVPLFFIFL